jgi:hypothetical protein
LLAQLRLVVDDEDAERLHAGQRYLGDGGPPNRSVREIMQAS